MSCGFLSFVSSMEEVGSKIIITEQPFSLDRDEVAADQKDAWRDNKRIYMFLLLNK